MSLKWLEIMIEKSRKHNQYFSLPFVIKSENNKSENNDFYFVWFSYLIQKTKTNQIFTHIDTVFCVSPEKELYSYRTMFDIPAYFDSTPPAQYYEYIPELEKIIQNYSDEDMNKLLQDKAYKPLFKSFMCVKDFISIKLKKESK